MPLADNPTAAFLLQYAYEPTMVYLLIVLLLTASSFGLPFPEEMVLLTAGLLAHIGSNPQLYPPPHAGAVGVSVPMTAAVCFFAVFLSDLLVFWLGKRFGSQMLRHPWAQKIISPKGFEKISEWTAKFGPLACGVFRFTPALRFPGHFACGATGIRYPTFILVDGVAALLTVPTQVLLMAYFGEQVLSVLKNVKIVLAIVIVLFLLFVLIRHLRSKSTSLDHGAK
jgi:membrane protein DedA with SNARE-associated domain